MIEVEIRARVENFDQIKNKLKEIKAKHKKTVRLVDRIFGHPMFLDSKKMIIEGGIVPRIRSVDNKNTLEFKEIRRKGAGIELESELGDVNLGIEFLEKLGFNEAFTIDKERESYKYKDFIIDLDSVDQLGSFIEIEKIVKTTVEKELAREECVNLLGKLSPESKIENRKYGDLMQELINKEKIKK
jgi:adenylate cyclase, class 2